MNIRLLAITAAATLLSAGAASAAVTSLTFTAAGAAQQVYINGFEAGSTSVVDTGLGATLDLTLASIGPGGYQWNFIYQISNLSIDASRLTTVGWDIDPTFAAVSSVAGTYSTIGSGAMPLLGGKDFCLKASGGANNCAGGGGGGLLAGLSGSGTFSLQFASETTTYTTVEVPKYNKGKVTGYETVTVPHIQAVPAPGSVTFDNFGAHYQSLASGGSTVGVPANRPFTDNIQVGVPEPASWAMMILGFGGVGAMIRRRRAAAWGAASVA